MATHSGNSLNNFMVIFGILLAAFTGVLSATNMSSELHKPRVSVPRGMAWACGTAIVRPYPSLTLTLTYFFFFFQSCAMDC